MKLLERLGGLRREVVWAFPDYDDLTGMLSRWRKRLRKVRAGQILYRERVRHEVWRRTVGVRGSGGMVLVFAGHGGSRALLTDPGCGENHERYSGEHSEFLGAGDVKRFNLKLEVFALACRAASEFGMSVRRCGGCFIGYDAILPFVVKQGEPALEEVFLIPLEKVDEGLQDRAKIDERTYEALIEFYDERLGELRSARGGRHEELIRIALRRHRKSLRILTAEEGADSALYD